MSAIENLNLSDKGSECEEGASKEYESLIAAGSLDVRKEYEAHFGANVIVSNQAFKYIARPYEEQQVCEYLSRRITKRANSGDGNDKTINPLIAVINSPGIGKSSFLANFPATDSYKKYASTNYGDEVPIVVPLTFNSGMDFQPTNEQGGSLSTLGLRVLYAAARCVGYTGNWFVFSRSFKEYYKLRLLESIVILKRVFGNRPILILVDEISKCGDEFEQKKVMTELGTILNLDGRTDIVVSALSPIYISDLLTRSNRLIAPVYLPPLLDYKLGLSETSDWLEREGLIQHTGKDIFTQRLLYNLPLFYSGLPRAIELFIDDLSTKVFTLSRSDIRVCIISIIASKLVNQVSRTIDIGQIPFIFNLAFSNIEYEIEKANVLRDYFDGGNILAIRGNNNPKRYRVMIPFLVFVDAIMTASKDKSIYSKLDLNGKCAVDLLAPLLAQKNVSGLWERSIFLSLISHGKEGRLFSTIFGITDNTGVLSNINGISNDLEYEIATDFNEYVKLPNTLLVAKATQSGYDGLVWFKSESGEDFYGYVHGKCEIDSTKNVSSVVAESISYILLAHPLYPRDKIAIIFYFWDGVDLPFADDLIALYKSMIQETERKKEVVGIDNDKTARLKSDLIAQLDSDLSRYTQAIEYVTNYYSDNVYAINNSTMMEDWLPPTVWTVPRLFQKRRDNI